MKIISVDKGFFIQGGTQLFGKYKSLKHCMKACAVTAACLAGDYNPWLHKCYQHSNYTACDTLRAHPQYVHFSKVPCSEFDRLFCSFSIVDGWLILVDIRSLNILTYGRIRLVG